MHSIALTIAQPLLFPTLTARNRFDFRGKLTPKWGLVVKTEKWRTVIPHKRHCHWLWTYTIGFFLTIVTILTYMYVNVCTWHDSCLWFAASVAKHPLHSHLWITYTNQDDNRRGICNWVLPLLLRSDSILSVLNHKNTLLLHGALVFLRAVIRQYYSPHYSLLFLP